MENTLYYGDNLDILRSRENYIKDESVDLIYLDPPFKSNKDYNVLFAEQDGSRAAAQIKAFEDTWRWDQAAEQNFMEIVEKGGKASQAMQSFRLLLGNTDMMAYLAMMAPRLLELRRVLKSSGSIYLHCDPTASHYLKLLMDAIFGPENFLNEIIWHYRKWPSGRFTFQRNHDVLLFYARSHDRERTFNQLYMQRAASTLKRFGTARIISGHDVEGRRVPSQMAEETSEGVRMDDVWNIGRVPPIKQLFPTEKPVALLERIITASSTEGSVILDPFCGCGTAIIVAQSMKNRSWIGIDITYLAIGLIKTRLHDAFGESTTYRVIGEPTTVQDAEELARSDPYQFQWWALGLVGARRTEQKKGADKGIDGQLYFHDDSSGKSKQVILSVKAGHTSAPHVRDLRGVIDRENAAIGVLITFQPSTQPMRTEAASVGFYDSPGWQKKYPRLQILTVGELLAGKGIDMPPLHQVNRTFRQAPRVRTTEDVAQLGLVAEDPEPYDFDTLPESSDSN